MCGRWAHNNFNTSDAILEFQCTVYSSIDCKQGTIVVHINFSKASDTVNHDILMSKLLYNGIRFILQSWFLRFIWEKGKPQFLNVKYYPRFSARISVGSTILFLVYQWHVWHINHMAFINFDDDTTQSEVYRRSNIENGWKSLIMVDHAWKCQWSWKYRVGYSRLPTEFLILETQLQATMIIVGISKCTQHVCESGGNSSHLRW